MKISIGTNIKEGPWGGGNLFAINLAKRLRSKGNEVFFNLNEKDLDKLIKSISKAKKYIVDKKIIKTIYIKNKIINYIVEKNENN